MSADDEVPKGCYRCELCREVFNEAWPDEVAHREALELFGRDGHSPDMAKVCDDCFRKLDAHYGFRAPDGGS